SHREGEVYSFPAGSIATARASGGDGDFTLTLQAGDDTVEGEEEVVEGGQARQFHLTLDRDGRLELREGGTALRGWDVTIVSDRAPEIAFTAPPRRARNGALELSYAVKDDYGVASAEAIIRPADAITDAEARPLYGPPELKLPLPARGKSEARVSRDLTAHPWAGAEVTMHLEAMDGSGQKGVSAEEHFVLPQRPFRNPLAQAVVEQRRI